MTFVGFLLFFDPPKPGVQETIADLAELGVRSRSSPATTGWWRCTRRRPSDCR